MVEIKGTSRDFILGINAQSEYQKYADRFQVSNLLKKKTRGLGKDAFVDQEPKDHRGENECMPPSYYLRWGFEEVEDDQWRHQYIRINVNVAPQYLEELSGADGKLEWKKLAEQMAYVLVHTPLDIQPGEYLCLTITDNRGAKIVPNRDSLPAMIEEAIANSQSITSDIGPKQKFWERLKGLFIQRQFSV